MPTSPEGLALLLGIIFLVAVAYSSVGHGGASGYLAALSLFGLAPAVLATSALVLNLLVAGMAWFMYHRSGYFEFRLLWPFLLGSIPLAFIGGMLNVSAKLYLVLLAAALLFAAIRLVMAPKSVDDDLARPPPLSVALPKGGLMGLVSGIVGIGGGIFLSPLMILLRWADAKRTAAVSAAFIWVNSAAGLYGQLSRKPIDWRATALLVAAAFAGGLLGSWLGSRRLKGIWLRRILAVVLITASVKLLRSAF